MQSAFAFPMDRPAHSPDGSRFSRPSYSAADVAALLWRERLLVLGVFVVLALLGAGVAMRMRTLYPAHSSLLIRLGQEYVYNPRVGDAARGAVPETDQVIQSETEILSSAVLKQRVIADIGLARIFPELGGAYARAGEMRRRAIEAAAMKQIDANLKIATAPDTSVVRLTYSHPDAQMAAQVLNTLVDEYLTYRPKVLVSHDAGVIGDERRDFQARLDAADAAYEKFLSDNSIGDFETEKASLGQLYSQLLTDAYSAQAQLSEAGGRLGVTSQEVGRAPAEIGLYRDIDHVAADKLLQLRIDRQDLLSRYQPGSRPVKDADRKIAELEALSASGQASGVGARRVGVNPVFQTLQTEKNQLEAETASLQRRRATLAAEIAQVSRRRQRLAELEPEYQDLMRQRDVLATNVRNFAAREQESQAQQAIAQKADDNVRVLQRAFPATSGVSFKKPMLLLAIVLAAFVSVCVGLIRAFLRQGYPTAASAERTLELPVLATARMRPAGP